MNKILCTVISSVFICLAGCQSHTQSAAKTQVPQVEFKVVGDRVVDITYNAIDEQKAVEIFNQHVAADKMGCSAAKVVLDNKVYVGRNYDFYCNDSPAFVVRNNTGKYRTIGLLNLPALGPWTGKDYQLPDNVNIFLPLMSVDVMNEEGLYGETNIRVFEPAFACDSTNPGKERRSTALFLQTMLSRYKTIDEVVAHIDDYDWFDTNNKGFNMSFFLVEPDGKSVIVEFADNQCRVQSSDYNANFYIDSQWYALEKKSTGEQRIARILSQRPYVRQPSDIYNMLETALYDQFYSGKADVNYAMPELYEDVGLDKDIVAADPKSAVQITLAQMKKTSKYNWEQRVKNRTWETVFSNVVNLTDREFYVKFSEHYGIDFKFDFEKTQIVDSF